jgi:hypothetical protein
LLLLGSREDNAHLGYVQARCPKCGYQGLLGVYLGKRKVTFAALVALPVAEQLYLECLECGTKLGVPQDQEPELRRRMVSREQLAGLASGASQFNEARNAANPDGRTAYQVLQLDTSAEPEVVQAAFKRLALKYHPDRSNDPAAAERMRELIAAHDLLTDPARKAQYDKSLGIERPEVIVWPPAMRADDV